MQLLSNIYPIALTSGPSGPQGAQGAQGNQGSVGPSGPQGADSTVVGPSGPQGFVGASGPQGVQGEVGPSGPQGSQGSQGSVGPSGPQGADSTVVGPSGPQGAQGEVGPSGPQGADSTVVGPSGPQGADSTVVGPSGPQGVQGSVGPSGPKGESEIYSFPNVNDPYPGNPDGNNPFFYIMYFLNQYRPTEGDTSARGTSVSTVLDEATGNLWSNTGTQWVLSGRSLKGLPGANGQVGPSGPQGTQGSVGPSGPQGTQGTQGSVGPSGPQGNSGLAGDKYTTFSTTSRVAQTGTTDFTVENGLALSPGQSIIISNVDVNQTPPIINAKMEGSILAYSGTNLVVDITSVSIGLNSTYSYWSISLSGAPGPAGPSGPQGAASTVVGPSGPQGFVGPSGPQGIQGSVGPSGPQGTQGSVGPSGPQGTQGTQGSVGPSGPQGTQGSVGPSGPQGAGSYTTMEHFLIDQTFFLNDTANAYADITPINLPVDVLMGVDGTTTAAVQLKLAVTQEYGGPTDYSLYIGTQNGNGAGDYIFTTNTYTSLGGVGGSNVGLVTTDWVNFGTTGSSANIGIKARRGAGQTKILRILLLVRRFA